MGKPDPYTDPHLSLPVNPELQSTIDNLPILRTRFRHPATSPDSANICTRPFAFIRHDHDCKRFYHCSWGVAYIKTCPLTTVWNSLKNYCDHPVNVQCRAGPVQTTSAKPTYWPTTSRPTKKPVWSSSSRPVWTSSSRPVWTSSLRPSLKPTTGSTASPLPPSSSCSGTLCGQKSSEPITQQIKNIRESTSCTLDNRLVELIQPGSVRNPENVKNVEKILPESRVMEFFPQKSAAYTYSNFLKAIGKYPAICSNANLCPKILANMFAHFEQETAGLFYIEEINKGRYCADWSDWVKEAYPCVPGKKYYGRGAKQLSWNYNYGSFSSAMFGDPLVLLRKPELVASTWLNFAAPMWFFVTPQPPKPSMLQVLDGSWTPNNHDLASNLVAGFGVTTMIINGGIECGKWNANAQNRAKYYTDFADRLGVNITGEKLLCNDMAQFSELGAMGQKALYWSPNNNCQLGIWQTAYSALVEGDYNKCQGLAPPCPNVSVATTVAATAAAAVTTTASQQQATT